MLIASGSPQKLVYLDEVSVYILIIFYTLNFVSEWFKMAQALIVAHWTDYPVLEVKYKAYS